MRDKIKKALLEGGMRNYEIASRIDESIEDIEQELQVMMDNNEVEISTEAEDDPNETYYVLYGWRA